MTAKNSKGGQKGTGGAALGVGLAAAAIAGAYFLYGAKDAAKRRAKVKGWMLKAKGEVLDRMETMKEVNEEAYNKIVDTVADKYKKAKNIDVAEVALMTEDLKKHWNNIKRQLNAGPKQASKKKPSSQRKAPSKSKKGNTSQSKS